MGTKSWQNVSHSIEFEFFVIELLELLQKFVENNQGSRALIRDLFYPGPSCARRLPHHRRCTVRRDADARRWLFERRRGYLELARRGCLGQPQARKAQGYVPPSTGVLRCQSGE